MTEPTDRQLAALTFVAQHIDERQRPPTLREIAAHLGVSPNAARDRVRSLVRKGLLRSEESVSRGLSVTSNGRAIAKLHETLVSVDSGADLPD